MTIAHIGAWKVAVILFNVAVVIFLALDPTVQVAMIAGTSLVVANVPALIIALLNHRTLTQSVAVARDTKTEIAEMKVNVDGNLTRLLNEKVTQSAQMVEKSEQLAHAEGRREGREAEQDRHDQGKD